MSYTAYKFSQHTANDTRDIEYRLLAQVTAKLLDLKGSTPTGKLGQKREMVDAILWNRDIWSALRADLSSDGNQLPGQLRASLISIAIWMEKECMKAIDDKGDLDAIIEINRNIMAGLKPHGDDAAVVAPPLPSSVAAAAPYHSGEQGSDNFVVAV